MSRVQMYGGGGPRGKCPGGISGGKCPGGMSGGTCPGGGQTSRGVKWWWGGGCPRITPTSAIIIDTEHDTNMFGFFFASQCKYSLLKINTRPPFLAGMKTSCPPNTLVG